MSTIGLILAAGKGTRMKSDLPKPVVPLKEKPIVKYIIDSFTSAGVEEVALVVGYKSEVLKEVLGPKYKYIEQKEQKGTGHAIMQARDGIDWKGKEVFIFVGDSPLIKPETVKRLLKHHQETGAHCTFLTSDFKMDLPYARIIRDEQGNLIKCVEEKNARSEELKIRELLSSHFVFKADSLFNYIFEIDPDPDNGEYYLTDILEIFLKNSLKVEILKIDDYTELVGLNTPEDLAWAEEILNKNNR